MGRLLRNVTSKVGCEHVQDKDAKKAKHGKRAKSDKRSRAGRGGSPDDSDDSGSGSDSSSGGRAAARAPHKAPQGGLQAELARARHAARCTRELLLRYPDQRRDLRQVLHISPPSCDTALREVFVGWGHAESNRLTFSHLHDKKKQPARMQNALEGLSCSLLALLQLLWTVDQGNALDVSGVADVGMRERLIELFSNLPLERTKKVQRTLEETKQSPSVRCTMGSAIEHVV